MFCPPRKKSILEKYKLLITGDDLKHLKAMLAVENFMTACTCEIVDTQWQFLKFINVAVFAFLLKNIPIG